jgi:predicted ester cyclase
LGHLPNEGHFEIDSIDIYRFSDNKIIEQWGIFDIVAMAAELGWDKSSL